MVSVLLCGICVYFKLWMPNKEIAMWVSSILVLCVFIKLFFYFMFEILKYSFVIVGTE